MSFQGTPSFQEGTVVRFDTTKTPFTSIDGAIVDPDEVIFSYIVPGQSEVVYTWTNPTGDPQDMIIHDGTGLFHIDLPTETLPGSWTYSWYGNATDDGPDSTGTTVKWESNITVTASVT